MKNTFIIILILLIFTCGLFSAKIVASFTEIGRPDALYMDKNQIYITERENIYIYSRDDFKLKNKFGKKGEGPKEFMMVPHFQLGLGLTADKIIIYSIGKISQFTKEGIFINETKLKGTHAYNIQPAEDFFLGAIQTPGERTMYNSAILYDTNLIKLKVLKKIEAQFRGEGKGTHVLENQLVFKAYGDKIFISDCDPFIIDVYNKKGIHLYSIKRKVSQIPISSKFAKKVREFFKTDPRYKDIYNYLLPITLAEYFPAIQAIFPDDKKLYVITWEKKSDHYNCFIFNTADGKFIKEYSLPFYFKSNMVEPFPFFFIDNTLYQLVDNPETEEWELLASPV